MNYIVNMNWDDEAMVWIATSDDVPGLALESGSLDALMERVRYAIPELLHLNSDSKNKSIPIMFKSERKLALAV